MGLITLLLAGEIILGVTCFALWTAALVHVVRHKHDSDRLTWVLIVCLTGPFGAVLYFAIGRPKLSSPTLANVSKPIIPVTGGPPFDHLAMHDEKKRAQAIIDSLSAMAVSKRRP